jgi:hypothetical protein
MAKLAKPTWFYILEAAKEFKGKPFTQTNIVDKVKEKAPRAKKYTILANIYGMTPNHLSSRVYPSILKNHAAFNYLGNQQFQMLEKEV